MRVCACVFYDVNVFIISVVSLFCQQHIHNEWKCNTKIGEKKNCALLPTWELAVFLPT